MGCSGQCSFETAEGQFLGGHQNGHQTSQKGYKLARTIRLDSSMKSSILASQSRVRKDNPGHWLYSTSWRIFDE
jgi:hypothetical protein